jgi:hypothetical protein
MWGVVRSVRCRCYISYVGRFMSEKSEHRDFVNVGDHLYILANAAFILLHSERP